MKERRRRLLKSLYEKEKERNKKIGNSVIINQSNFEKDYEFKENQKNVII